ncbi:diacylglycerol/lipid kinase family protein [Chondromyces apiculatus]|uniref:Diacylglycerol kinase-related protein n=1 Tax=Chondromyces apiculatus DSM 436 TaxID=1192034 RepID=A0A017T8S9_9BACT|nr:diacylglycerol kinase family protein [Chondromyces apiculatus]EYF05658.1 diacylglycerol kinase-related protein [Chondromyces apiculatus DSM 436]
MRAILMHNPDSGTAEDERTLIATFGDIGWDVRRTLTIDRLTEAIRAPEEALIVAGGDGTVTEVAKRLAGTDIPLAVVPTGTANNVARSLGVGAEARPAIKGLAHPMERRVDLGVLRQGRGEKHFFEGFGVGVFAYVLGELATDSHKKLPHARELLAEAIEHYTPRHVHLHADGEDLSGEYLLAAVMNMRSFGPALIIAPDARLDDGLFDLVLIRPETRHTLLDYLRCADDREPLGLPTDATHRARHVRLRSDGAWSNLDETPRRIDGEVDIHVQPAAVRFLLPSL